MEDLLQSLDMKTEHALANFVVFRDRSNVRLFGVFLFSAAVLAMRMR